MSLLMKALEKAAKDRDDARTEPAAVTPAPAAAAAPRSELTLEPLKMAPQQSAAAPESPVRPAAAARSAGAGAPSREQAQAASVLEAGSSARGDAPATRVKPLLLFGAVAGLIAIGFGTYVYLQVFHPSLFYKAPPVALKPLPGPAAPAASAPGTAPATGSLPPAGAEPAPPPVAAAPVLKESAPSAGLPAPAPGATSSPAPAPASTSTPARTQPQPQPQTAPAPAIAAPAPAPRAPIVVSRSTETPTVHPLLTEGYSALQSEQLAPARGAYDRLLRADPRSTDALLGLAAVDVLEGKNEEAIRRYLQVLDVEPRNATAQSGLIGLLGRADPQAAESRLKQLIAREPSAFLYFTLGNLYADQSRWAPAQQAYFQAHHLDPNNADYAYNLAIGLEHMSQRKLALGFYRRAVQLAGGTGRAHFNLALAQDRISRLASQVE